MNRSTLLMLSLGVNALLAAGILLWSQPRPAPGPVAPIPNVQPTNPVAARMPALFSETNSGSAAIHPTFHWRDLESENYQEYMANLRATGCPERTLRDILVADIHKLYRLRSAAIFRTPVEPWRNRDHRRKQNRAHHQQDLALRAEKQALLELLFGPEGPDLDPDLAIFEDSDEIGLLLGFMDDARARRVVAAIVRHGTEWRESGRLNEGILIDEDYARGSRLERSVVDELNRLVSPAEMLELECRIQLEGPVFGRWGLWLDGIDLTGPEMRRICELSRSLTRTLTDGLFHPRDPSEEEHALRLQSFRLQIEELLGPARRDELSRAQDADFRAAWKFARHKQLPESAAIEVHAARQDAVEAVRSLQDEKLLSAADRAAALALLQEATRRRVLNVLGPQAGPVYLDHVGTWLNSLETLAAEAGERAP